MELNEVHLCQSWARIFSVLDGSNGASEYFSVAPGGRPVPDDQGDLQVCTPFAMSKAVVDYFMTQCGVDIDQKAVTGILLKEHKDGAPRWPQEFDGKVFQFQDTQGSHLKTRLNIKQVQKLDSIRDITSPKPPHTYVLGKQLASS